MASNFNASDLYDRKARGGPEILSAKVSKQSWFGSTAITSDTLGPSCVVSTTLVASSSFFRLALKNEWVTGSVMTAPNFAVATISDGGFFRVAAVNSTTNVGSFTLYWEIVNPKP